MFEPITIAAQGSFFIGGRKLHAPGVHDAALGVPSDEGETFWVDQMYVQYQVPQPSLKPPLILVHGGFSTGKAWESTPDGREGYQTLMLRAGHPVYVVDLPRRGRAGFPSFNGPFGQLAGERIVSTTTTRAGAQYASSRWRISHDPAFERQRFPVEAQEQFLQQLVPTLATETTSVVAALALLLERTGPAVLVTHSQAGLFGWLTASASDNLLAIISYEPGFVFPHDRLPADIPLLGDAYRPGIPIDPAQFDALARIPIQVVYGDNIPQLPVADRAADERRAQLIASQWFCDEVRRCGGKATVLQLPHIGIRGNSHFMFADSNNAQIAALLGKFLNDSGIATGSACRSQAAPSIQK